MTPEQINKLAADVAQGVMSALEAYALLKSYDSTLKDALKAVEEQAFEEAQQHGKKFDLKGYRFEVREGRRMYSFKDIEPWNEANTRLKAIEEYCKQAATLWEKGKQMITKDGEVVAPAKVSYSKPSLVVKPIE